LAVSDADRRKARLAKGRALVEVDFRRAHGRRLAAISDSGAH
jgi:hypothetical protein